MILKDSTLTQTNLEADRSLRARESSRVAVGGYVRATCWTLAAWIVFGLVVVGVVMSCWPGLFVEAVVISVASGATAMVSLVPGFVPQIRSVDGQTGQDTNGRQNYINCVFSGMILRLVATVALFVLCRYQMAASDQWIAGMIISWYAVLTAVEVIVLARYFPQSDAIESNVTNSVAGVLVIESCY